MKICSFLPSATEILFALDLGDSVQGVTFECDYPSEARRKSVVVHSKLPHGLAEKEIDSQVNEFSRSGQSLYRLDAALLRQIQPDMIITQDLCHVCAATPDDLAAVLSGFEFPPKVISLTPHTIEEVWNDIQTVGDACGRSESARELVANLRQQIANIKDRVVRTSKTPPRVLCLEWLDPPFIGGHWVPEMVALAGGIDILGKAGLPGVPVTWEAIVQSDPDLILVMPCGYHRAEVEKELAAVNFPAAWHSLRAVQDGQVFAMDASSHFSRPGPRIVEGILEMAEIFGQFVAANQRKAPARDETVTATPARAER